MSASQPLEQALLAPVDGAIAAFCQQADVPARDARLEVLEAVASRLGGWRLDEYRQLDDEMRHLDEDVVLAASDEVLDVLGRVAISPTFALCALARPELVSSDRRKDGVYYTDFRLAQLVADGLLRDVNATTTVVDAACGTGILLAAVVLKACGNDGRRRGRMLAEGVSGADLSDAALRGARLALASLTDSLDAVAAMTARLRLQDSLILGLEAWHDVAPQGFDVVVGNPPWEKLKVSRHEYLLASGVDRHYGDDYAVSDTSDKILEERGRRGAYAATLNELYPLQGSGEPDLYKAFFELSCRLAGPDGQLGLLVPAGLIRSDGTRRLREFLLETAAELRITVLENRARFFEIDTRFKFLALHATHGGLVRRAPINLRHATGTPHGTQTTGDARIGRAELRRCRPDLTVPEVRSDEEWRTFTRMADAGMLFGDPAGMWRPTIVREVDMTRDRKNFVRHGGAGLLALIEGRMVHQFRFGAKSYLSGTGRRALWAANPIGAGEIAPQFWIAPSALPPAVLERTTKPRVGFCDVTGQTNERSLLAALIPAGVACGNKVPTITFGAPNDDDGLVYLWLAIANSVPFDWMIRRVLTTTVNYFLLLGLPFPTMSLDGLPARRLITLARDLTALDQVEGIADSWAIATKRAEVDVRVASAYGLDTATLGMMLRDFPLLDRGQPPIAGEKRSTITRDLILSTASALLDGGSDEYADRVAAARAEGAVAYIPAEYAASQGAPRADLVEQR